MAGYDAAFREATNSLEADRGRAEASVKSRREALYVKYPRLKEIEDRSVVLGGALVKSALDGPGSQTADIAAEIESLNLEKDELMRRAGLPRDYYSSAYACPACLDTGRTANPDGTGKRCQCFRRRLTEAYYGLSNVKAAVEEENFERFDLRYYSNQKDLNEGLSPAENMRTVLKATKEFVDNFGNKFQNLLLYGVTGLGKTYLCNCVAKELLDRGFFVLYLSAPKLFKSIEDRRFNRAWDEVPDDAADATDEADLLIIDDVGSEFATVVTCAAFFEIINSRLLSQKPTVISTNLSPNELGPHYSERITSRLFGNYELLKFFGDDIRLMKKYNPKKNKGNLC